jgi:all-trans-retinol dehydrogenase (NAD+)
MTCEEGVYVVDCCTVVYFRLVAYAHNRFLEYAGVDVPSMELVFPALVIVACVVLHKLLSRRRHDLFGQVVLVTGSGMGIGREMALRYARRGCSLVLWDICLENAEKVAAEIRAEHPDGLGAHAFQCDVSSEDAVNAAAAATLATVGHIDVLVNNAGIVSGRPLLELSSTQIERTIGVNALAHFWTVRAFLPGMIACRQGHVVNIASIMGMMGGAGLSDYCASKFAAVGLTHCLRLELTKHNNANPGTSLGCTLVCPFMINTGMFDGSTVRFFPVLEPGAVAERVVLATELREPQVVLPAVIHWVWAVLQLFPIEVMDFVVAWSGGLDGMDHFKGRRAPVRAPNPAVVDLDVASSTPAKARPLAASTKASPTAAAPTPSPAKRRPSTKRAPSPSPSKVPSMPAVRRTTRKTAPRRKNIDA